MLQAQLDLRGLLDLPDLLGLKELPELLESLVPQVLLVQQEV